MFPYFLFEQPGLGMQAPSGNSINPMRGTRLWGSRAERDKRLMVVKRLVAFAC